MARRHPGVVDVGMCIGALAVAVALSACQEARTASAPPVGAATATATTPELASPSPSAPQVPEADPAWLPPPWTLQSTTRAAPVGATKPEYLFCGWRVPPSRVLHGDRTAVTEQVLVHPAGLRARLIRYETDVPGGVWNLFKLSYDSCLVPGNAKGVGGPRNLWVYRGVAGGSDLGSTRGIDPQVMHVGEISSKLAERRPTRDDVAAALDAWAKIDLASR